MQTIRAQVEAAREAIGRASLHLAAADAHAAAGDPRETEHQLRLAVGALDAARGLAVEAATRAAALPGAAPSVARGADSVITDGTGRDVA